MEYDLKEIAVKFDNKEQREKIFENFKNKGFKIPNNPSVFIKGYIGYSYNLEYICVLSDEALANKIKISYDDFIRGKEMKKLEVSLKIQPDGKTVIVECTHIDDELRGKGLLIEKDGYKIASFSNLNLNLVVDTFYVRGRAKDLDYKVDYGIFGTQEEAEKFVKIINELINEINNPKTDWSKIEEGTEIIVDIPTDKTGELVGFLANFHHYIKNLNKIIIITKDNEVKVVDEEFCKVVKYK